MNVAPAPPVLLWQRIYCGLMTAIYLVLTAGGVAAAVFRRSLADAETSPGEVLFGGVAIAAISAACAAVYGAAFFLPRRRWAWVYNLVLIGIGMTSCACLPFVVPLLVLWLRPDVQAYYGGPRPA